MSSGGNAIGEGVHSRGGSEKRTQYGASIGDQLMQSLA
jgi:hypothetical protein